MADWGSDLRGGEDWRDTKLHAAASFTWTTNRYRTYIHLANFAMIKMAEKFARTCQKRINIEVGKYKENQLHS
jgi:hypothetical protein